jgi:hypothetical protein
MQRLETYGYQKSKAMELLRIAIHCIGLREETTLPYASASSSELLNDLCKDHEILTIEQAQHDPHLIGSSRSALMV